MDMSTSEFLKRPEAIPLGARVRRTAGYRSPATPGACLRWMLIAGIGVHAIGLLVALGILGRLGRAQELAVQYHLPHTVNNYGEVQPLGMAEHTLPFLLAGLFALFFGIAYANLPNFVGHATRFRPVWAIASWFVPVLCLLRPRQVVEEIWAGSEPAAAGERILPQRGSASLPFMGAWWTAWIFSEALYRLADELSRHARTIEAAQRATGLVVAAEGMFVIAACFLQPVVTGTIRRQQARAAQLGLRDPS
jgi:hypothetical protein